MAEAVTKLSIALVGWQVIPAVASNIIARIWMSATGKQLSARERHYIILSGLFSYLLINFVTAITGVEASFYELLHVPPDADENAIRLAFRAFARKNHPDRVGPSGADMFMAVRHGYESLMDPNKRWAYDRCASYTVPAGTLADQIYADLEPEFCDVHNVIPNWTSYTKGLYALLDFISPLYL